MPIEAKKLCRELLQVEPHKRLGSGPKDSPLSYEMLKKHEFFKGVDFANVSKVVPPIDPTVIFKLRAERKASFGPEPGMDSPDENAIADCLEDGVAPATKSNSCPDKKEEQIVKEGMLYKKCGWIFYKKRNLVLTSRPRLSYHDAKNGLYKVSKGIKKRRAIFC